ncbi:MAG: regulatory protein RecX [Candidatus Ratteibacteria bacterium]|nr:regulatory protein RecX [Candidatus Ratteibacteria bacterium]
MQEEIEKAKSSAFKLLSYRIRSCKEISDKLKDKGFSQSVINSVIEDLKRIDYLNDYKFAKEFIESRLIHNPKGKKLLRYELLKKGIEEGIIDGLLREQMPEQKEELLAQTLAEKIWQRKKNIEINKRKAQTYDYLARRGFSVSLATKILEEISRQKQ